MSSVWLHTGESRRRADRARTGIFARIRTSLGGELSAVVGGRLLLAAVGVTATVFAPLFDPDRRGWLVLGIVAIVMLALLCASFVAPWPRLPTLATIVFPASVCAAFVAISLGSPGLVAPLSGVLTLCFAYIGLSQSAVISVFALPVAGTTFVIMNGGFSLPITVRLVINIVVWLLLAQLLARFTVRHAALTWELRRAAHTDALTGVANRRDLDKRMLLAERGDALVICDLDNFKRLNDALGHGAGDQVLSAFGAVLRADLRADDYCARYGGEEFFLLLPATGAEEAEAVLGRLHASWAKVESGVTFSAGIAICSVTRTHAATLTAADRALYAAKASGRNADRTDGVLV